MSENNFRYQNHFRKKLHTIIFGTDTKAGKLFDVILLYAILMSIIIVMVESVEKINIQYAAELRTLEWIFTIFFTVEYVLRLYSSTKPLKYAFSFLGIIDLLALIPTYMTIFIPGAQFLIVVRAVRLLRVFRVMKLTRYLGEANVLGQALWNSRRKIIVFLGAVMSIVIISGTVMYVIEGAENGFNSIPLSIYWAVVTLTTVGYGDIAPQTTIGQTFSVILMLTGYAIIAVPTGIVTTEIRITEKENHDKQPENCLKCDRSDHDGDADFCKFCGIKIVP